jgi:hypothetical protein
MNRYDQRETYCRSLGDCVQFAYCRVAGGNLPCSRILDCWIGRFPVLEFLNEHYTGEQLCRIFAPAPGRLERILQIAERVRKNVP